MVLLEVLLIVPLVISAAAALAKLSGFHECTTLLRQHTVTICMYMIIYVRILHPLHNIYIYIYIGFPLQNVQVYRHPLYKPLVANVGGEHLKLYVIVVLISIHLHIQNMYDYD